MKKYKYDIGLMFVYDFNEFMDRCNKRGQEGWELVQWEQFNCVDPFSKAQQCLNSNKMNILVTWKKEV